MNFYGSESSVQCMYFRSQFSFNHKWTFAALNHVRGVFQTSIKTMDRRIINGIKLLQMMIRYMV